MGEFSVSHMIILAVILLVFFGPSRLPAFGQSLGKAIKGFKSGLNEIDADAKDVGPQAQIKQNEDITKQTTDDKMNQNKS
ncbi:MAG: twin-arginine translocase TatA/TatE family subunit [Bdellovibrio sp.]|nr:twin-arginine translocase TatA/TatE family subunit [Bdellovibrio sp.]